MSLKIETTLNPKPIVRELENGSKVKFRFTWKEDHFQIETKLYSGNDVIVPCKWPATLKGVSNHVNTEELKATEEFLNKAKLDVQWALDQPIILISSNKEKESIGLSNTEIIALPPLKALNSELFSTSETLSMLEKGEKLSRQGRLEEALQLFSRVEKSALDTQNEQLLAEVFIYQGHAQILKEEFEEAYEYFNRAWSIILKNKDLVIEAKCYLGVGDYYYHIGSKEASVYFNKALDIGQKLSNPSIQAEATLGISKAAFWIDKDNKKGLEYSNKALLIASNIKDLKTEAMAYMGLGYGAENFEKQIEYYKTGLSRALEIKDRIIEAKIYYFLSSTYFNSGNFNAVLEYSNKALELFREQNYLTLQAKIYHQLGATHYNLGDNNIALTCYYKDLNISIEFDNQDGQLRAYNSLGDLYNNLGNSKLSTEYKEKAASIEKKPPLIMFEAPPNTLIFENKLEMLKKTILPELEKGARLVQLGKIQQALSLFLEVEEKSRNFQEDQILGNVYVYEANAYMSKGDYTTSIEYFNKALSIGLKVKDTQIQANCYMGIGNCFIEQRELKKALECFNKSLFICQGENQEIIASSFIGISEVYSEQSDFNQAFDNLHKALTINSKLKNEVIEAKINLSFGKIFLAKNNPQKSIEYLNKALLIGLEIEDYPIQGAAYYYKALAYSSVNFKEEVENNNFALNTFTTLENRIFKGKAYRNLGVSYQKNGNIKKAIEYFKHDLEIAIELKDPKNQELAYENLSSAYKVIGEANLEKEYKQKAYEIKNLSSKNALNQISPLSNSFSSNPPKKTTKKLPIDQLLETEGGNAILPICFLAHDHQSAKEFKKAQSLCMSIEELAESYGNQQLLAILYEAIGNYSVNLKEDETALKYYEKAATSLEYVDSLDQADLGRVYRKLSNSSSDITKAIEYNQKALDIFFKLKDHETEKIIIEELSKMYEIKENQEKESSTKKKSPETLERTSLNLLSHISNNVKELKENPFNQNPVEILMSTEELLSSEVGQVIIPYILRGREYEEQGNFTDALVLYLRFLPHAKRFQNQQILSLLYESIGLTYSKLNNYEKTIEYFEHILNISIKLNDINLELTTYNHLGKMHSKFQNPLRASEYFTKELALSIRIGDFSGQKRALQELGTLYLALGDFTEAKRYYLQNLKLVLGIKNLGGEGEAYNQLGNLHFKLKDFQEALRYYNNYLNISKKSNNLTDQMISYINLGNVNSELGEYRRALTLYKKSLEIAKNCKNDAKIGQLYTNIGNLYNSLGNHQRALLYHHDSLRLAIQLKDRNSEAKSYVNMGNVHLFLDEPAKAKKYYKNALSISIEMKNQPDQRAAHNNLGVTYARLKKYDKALNHHKKALTIFKESDTYLNLGNIYSDLKDFKTAIDCYKKALEISPNLSLTQAKNHYSLAQTYLEIKDYSSAELNAKKAIEIYSNFQSSLEKDSWKITSFEQLPAIFHVLLVTCIRQQKYKEALCIADFGRSRSLSDTLSQQFDLPFRTQPLEPADLQKIAQNQKATLILYSPGDFEKEDELFCWIIPPEGEILFYPLKSKGFFSDVFGSAFSSLSPFQTRGEATSNTCEWEFENLVETEETQEEKTREAPSLNDFKIKSAKKALTEAKTPQEKFKAFEDFAKAYRGAGQWELLLNIGMEIEALALEGNDTKNQCEAYLILAEAHNGLKHYSEALKFGEQAMKLAKTISSIEQQARALHQLAIAESDPAKAFELCQNSLKLMDLIGEPIAEAKTSRVLGTFLLKNPELVKFLKLDSSSISSPIGAFERALFLLGDFFDPYERLLILQGLAEAHEKEKDFSKSLPNYNRAIQLSKKLNFPQTEKELILKRKNVAQSLKEKADSHLKEWYSVLIYPIEKHLKKSEKIIFIPHTPLQSLPFAILRNPKTGRYLIEDHIISSAPSIEVLNLLHTCAHKRDKPTEEAFVIGDPTLDLKNSEQEARIVGNLFDTAPLIGQEATASKVTKEAPNARFLHLSCHGIAGLKPKNKPDSVFEGALKLASESEEDTYLHALNIQDLPLKAELVFLAACKSGKGKLQKEGTIGLTRSFMAAGVPSVIATHWSIPDSPVTVDIIENFYAYILGKHPENDYKKLGKAEALQRTMINLLEESPELREQPQKWGAFFLEGLDEKIDF